jgi:type IV pilus assembly protein PilY1
MVVGMRFGGASIVADIDKTDGPYDSTKDPTMKSAFMIFDITDPEIAPELLGEITMPNMGFSTSYPTMVMMKDGNHNGIFENYNDTTPVDGENRWFLAFGSGPADVNGDPHPDVLDTAASSQKGKFYLLDLVKLVSKKELWTLTDGPTESGVLTQGLHYYTEIEDNSFVGDPITVDYNLDFNDDALYYGTVSTGDSKWEGKLRRIVVDDLADSDEDQDPRNWQPDSILFDAQQPITAAANVGLDDDGRFWIFFGTGRYYVLADGQDVSQQSFYGIKEPIFLTDPSKGANKYTTVLQAELTDVTDYIVSTGSGDVVDTGFSTNVSWEDLIDDQASSGGWFIDFAEDDGSLIGERSLGQSALIGGALTFTTFIPSEDPCVAGGTSWLWVTYYKTGTAYSDPIIGEESGISIRKTSLGEGLTTTPGIHVGGEDGTKAFIQNSNGAIEVVEEKNPYNVKSGVTDWAEVD